MQHVAKGHISCALFCTWRATLSSPLSPKGGASPLLAATQQLWLQDGTLYKLALRRSMPNAMPRELWFLKALADESLAHLKGGQVTLFDHSQKTVQISRRGSCEHVSQTLLHYTHQETCNFISNTPGKQTLLFQQLTSLRASSTLLDFNAKVFLG